MAVALADSLISVKWQLSVLMRVLLESRIGLPSERQTRLTSKAVGHESRTQYVTGRVTSSFVPLTPPCSGRLSNRADASTRSTKEPPAELRMATPAKYSLVFVE